MIIKDYSIGTVLVTIRKFFCMTQEEFSKKLNVPRSWLSKKETENDRIYIKDFITILNKSNFDLYIINVTDERKISLKDYNPGFILRVVREWSGLNMKEFSNTIGKKTSWQSENEAENINYFANDLFTLIKNNGFKILLEYSEKRTTK